jgi:hypothetical protein
MYAVQFFAYMPCSCRCAALVHRAWRCWPAYMPMMQTSIGYCCTARANTGGRYSSC